MPDNVAITQGTGTTVSTEEITTLNGSAVSAQHAQRVIPAIRTADGTAVDVTSAAPMPISDAGGSITVDGTLALTGEAHMGQMGGHTVVIQPTIVLSPSPAYSAGDTLMGEITLTNAMRITDGSGILTDIVMTDADAEGPALQILLFNSNPASTSIANAAFAWGSGDLARLAGIIEIAAVDWLTIAGEKVVHKRGLTVGVKASGSTTNLYAHILVASGSPQYTSSNDVTAAFKFVQD
jgi:hypothetical protein